MMTRFALPVRANVAAIKGKRSSLIIDAEGVAVGGFFGDQCQALAEEAAAAINAKADLIACLRQARREYAAFGHLSGETLVQIDNALAGKAVPA
ncbi:hypothetical protein [Mesorhizobium sp.]|uniref:hypothetical protein n=1 Tax=Mesorhizobium sp. TaxID=1871066 RepID=UPI0012251CAA|nr:hypothetical protein [Mesorhizobium sp.]TIL30010.1 MAG: hypothetical protein E5Y85_25620 [Mesorhizobium sp.]